MKWTPAILHHSDALTGKAGAVYKHNQMASQGMLYNNLPITKRHLIMTVTLLFREKFYVQFVQRTCDTSLLHHLIYTSYWYTCL